MVLQPLYTPPGRAMTVHQAIRLARAAAAAAGRERGELAPLPRKTRIIPTRKVRPHRDSNSGYRRERAVSWASRRWGRRRARLAQLLSAVHGSELHHFEGAHGHRFQLVRIGDRPARIVRAGDGPELTASGVGDEHA